MNTPTYESLLESARQKMIADFEIAKRDVPHYGERGEELERVVINWLSNYLPKRYAVGTGFILGLLNEISPQTDAVIYDAFNCPILRYSDKSLILPADNVAVAIEIKSNLNKQQFEDAVEKTKIIKSLSKSPISEFDLLSEGAKKVVQRQTYSILFAFESDTSLETITKWYIESFINGRHLDYVCVLCKGWIDLIARPSGSNDYMPVHCPEAIIKPSNTNYEIELWAGYHEEPENALYFMLRNIVSHLQIFRNQMYIPDISNKNQKPTKCNLKLLGTLPSNSQFETQEPIKRLKKVE